MVESSTIFLVAFFGVAIVGTPFAVKWLADRNKGTSSEQASYDKYKETYIGKITYPFHTDVAGGMKSIIDYINKNRRD